MKKIVSILLALMLVVSMTVISASAFSAFDEQAEKISDAIAAYEAENEVKVPTYRYYFQIPDGTNGPVKSETDAKGEAGSKAPSWINEYNEGLCSIYYWAKGDFPTPSAWTGYVAEAVEGVDNLFYADVPQNVSTIIWNNGIDGGTDNTNPLYFLRAQTANIKVESLDEGDDDNFPDGLESYDNMIWIVNPDKVSVNSFSGAQTCGGDWYYYYGSGCYGLVAGGEEDVKENCLNPDHDHSADPTEEPTEIVTEEPTAEPTDEPTEIVTEEPTEITTDEPTEEPTAAPVSEKKIYVVGNMTDWTVNEAYEMTLNEEADTTEYSFTMDLTTDSQFKCVVESEGERSWYPDGMGNNYGENGEITANGTYTIYFRPNLDGGDDWFYNCIYVAGEEVVDPTAEPTEEPTEVVTEEPTEVPTEVPTAVPTDGPTQAPTEPSEAPTQAPTEKPFVLGDADRSGKVEITDATIIQRWLASMITEERIDLKAADVDGDDKATIRDVTIIQKFLATLCNIDGTPLKPLEPTEPAPTDVPTEAPTEPAEPKDPVIYFDANSTDLGSYKRIFAHIWKYGGDSFFEWQVKKERCTDQGDGIWAYDLNEKGITLEDGVMYCIIFSTDEGAETYQIFFDPSCYGDTVYCVDEKTENPVDSNKSSYTAYYRNADKTKYGPVLAISSIGNVVGTACAPDTTPYKMFVSFLKDPMGLANAREFTKQSDKEIIDPIAEKLGLSEEEVKEAITESGAEVDY